MTTIQDVLDAGGDISGLPVKSHMGREAIVLGRQDMEIYCYPSKPFGDHPYARVFHFPADHFAWTVRADGIRVIEENGRLWCVLKASAKIGTNLRNNTHGFLTLKPLIPDKPKPKACDENIKAAYDQRRFGRFRIDRNQLRDTPHRVLEFFLRSEMLILKAEYLPELDGPEYTVVHPDFAPVPQGEFAPLYALSYSVESVRDGKTEEKIVGWNVTDERMK